jgi:hypothetical protein
MNTYEEGDQIYLFGFSRGAYTVRALAGMLHMFGLLHQGNEGLISYILKIFARRTRAAKGLQPEFAIAAGFKSAFSRTVSLQLVGVWDTVSSVGMIWDPLKLPFTAKNPITRNGRHAVSIDERRCFFRNNLWAAPDPDQSIKQVWFAGEHSDVGGSYPQMESGLSQITLQWMLCEAVKLGLLVNAKKAAKVLGRVPPPPPLAWAWWILEVIPHRTYDATTGKVTWGLPLGRSRVIPPGSTFHQSVVDKLKIDPTYKPDNLPQDWDHCIEPENACLFE